MRMQPSRSYNGRHIRQIKYFFIDPGATGSVTQSHAKNQRPACRHAIIADHHVRKNYATRSFDKTQDRIGNQEILYTNQIPVSGNHEK
jgi:hypothetical protein